MKSIKLFYISCLLFSLFVFAQSDQEKIEIIENLAKPFPETKVFYRWQSEASTNTLIKKQEVTHKQFYAYFIKKAQERFSTPGLHIAEGMYSSGSYGSHILRVEINSNTKYIDLIDPQTWEALKKANISHKEVLSLTPNIAVKRDPINKWWVVRSPENVKFKPFSFREVSLQDLAISKNANILEREQFKHPSLMKDFEKKIQEILKSPIQSLNDGKNLLYVGENHLSSTDVKKIVNQTLPYINTAQDGVDFLSKTRISLSKSDKNKIMNKIASVIREENLNSLNLIPSEYKYIHSKIKSKKSFSKKRNTTKKLRCLRNKLRIP